MAGPGSAKAVNDSRTTHHAPDGGAAVVAVTESFARTSTGALVGRGRIMIDLDQCRITTNDFSDDCAVVANMC
jgi:hypothetical protein